MTKEEFKLRFMLMRANTYDAKAGDAYITYEPDRTKEEQKLAEYFPAKVMEELSLADAVVECLDEYQEEPLFDDSINNKSN